MKIKDKLISLISLRYSALVPIVVLAVALSGCVREIMLTPKPEVGSVVSLPMSAQIEVTESVAKVNMALSIKYDVKQAIAGYFKDSGVFREIVETGGDAVLKVQSRFVFEGRTDAFYYSFEFKGALQGAGKALGNYHAECSARGGSVRLTAEADREPMNRALTECLDKLASQIEADGPTIMAKRRGEPVNAAQTELPLSPIVTMFKSDVDELPSIKAKTNQNAYAIVIGIETYRQKLPKADYAVHDAQTMTEYLTKVMGYPEENVITLINDRASKSDMEKYFEKWLKNNVEKDGTVFIYYSGHGAPNPKTGDAFLAPYDVDPAFIDETGYSIKRLYDALGKLPAKEIVVALDSCFSGAGGRSVIAKGARPLVMNLDKEIKPLAKNMTVMSASSGDEISSTYDEKGHGLFTYFFLKGLKGEGDANGDGRIDTGELFHYLKPQVTRTARKAYNNEQSPQIFSPVEGKGVQLR